MFSNIIFTLLSDISFQFIFKLLLFVFALPYRIFSFV
jgi:hypothetical protein